MPVSDPSPLPAILLAWYDRAGRDLPWRKKHGEVADPYHVWLSEVMLQQTTVVAVAPYFRKFIQRWPKVTDLAAASEDEVMHAWAGLGYYARARNLHACAKMVTDWRGGRFPDDEESLRQLPGIGDYTAAAITAIAFGKRAVVMDGNVERVVARLFAVTEPLPAVKPRLKALAGQLTPDFRPGDYAQAVMDLGATICTPRNPACVLCPWMTACQGLRQGVAAGLPAKLAKPERPTRHGTAYWATRKDGAVLIRRRPPQGLLGGMMEIPSTPWRDSPWETDELAAQQPLAGQWRPLPGLVRHTFTHFHLELKLVAAKTAGSAVAHGLWVPLDQLGDHALPSVMGKVIRHALAKAY